MIGMVVVVALKTFPEFKTGTDLSVPSLFLKLRVVPIQMSPFAGAVGVEVTVPTLMAAVDAVAVPMILPVKVAPARSAFALSEV